MITWIILLRNLIANFLFPGQEIIQEQITRVLLERLIVNRPHPWGLLINFIELIKVMIFFFFLIFFSFSVCIPTWISNFIELVNFLFLFLFFQNQRYNFWNRAFIRCAPEIEKLFESVSRSCGGPKSVDESMVSSWVSDAAHWSSPACLSIFLICNNFFIEK